MSTETKKSSYDPCGSKDRQGKGGLSCAECRRSKLKCDRVFPCQSCIRRGCAAICPEGSLAATKGNKFLMAHAQRLAEQVNSMKARIRELENALAQTRSQEEGVHPLLSISPGSATKELGNAEYDWESGLHEVTEAIGSLSIGADGQARYHGETAGSEYFQDLLPVDESTGWDTPARRNLCLPYEIIELMNAFPFGLKDCPYTKIIFLPFLPSRARSLELADLYYKNASWMYNPITRGDFISSMLDPIFGDTTTAIPSVDIIHSHRLAVFFSVMSNGVLFDSHPSSKLLSEQFHALALATFSLDSILQEATCATVQALFMMFRFIYNSDRTSNEARWLYTGLCARVAQTIGLQRDSAGWNLDAEEIQRRRVLYWELYTYDAWTSLVNGRPPALMIQHTDAHFPDDLDQVLKPSGDVEMGFHAWKCRYSASCLSISVQHVFSTKVPLYSALLELDKKIRKFPVPTNLQSPMQLSETGCAWSADPSVAMQQHCLVCVRESNLLYIHRSYFAQAIREESSNPLKHKYAQSVLAVYRSACRLISSLRGVYALHPKFSSDCWFFWSAVFSSCIVLGALIVESPGCTLAQDAFCELECALPFYDEGSRHCRPPATLIMLQRLHHRAYTSFSAFHAGLPNEGSRTDPQDSSAPDELAVLRGQKTVISNKTSHGSPASVGSSGMSQMQPEFSEGGQLVANADALLDYYNELGNPDFSSNSWGMQQGPLVREEPIAYPYRDSLPTPNRLEQISARDLLAQYLIESTSQCAVPSQQPFNSPAAQSLPLQYPQPTFLGSSTNQEQNQDEIWRNFVLSFGLEKDY